MGFSTVTKALTVLVAMSVAGCAGQRPLTPHAVSQGPDEFSVVPNKPLEPPTSYSELPVPTPARANLADATPKQDAVAALGGRLPLAGLDGGIVSHASRYGVDPAIRAALAESDERFQKRRQATSLIPRRFAYERAYRGQALNAWAEWERLRALGVVVPSAPQQ